MSAPVGETAALTAALFWALSSTLFTLASRATNPYIVNRLRLIGALVLVGGLHTVLIGAPLPKGASTYQWLVLGLSAIIGLVIGDSFLLMAYVKIGPRLSMLLMSMVPIVTTGAAWVLFGEHLSALKLAGIAVTISGVSWVVLEKGRKGAPFKVTRLGLFFGIGAMLGQAIGLVLSKEGMRGGLPPITATYIRTIWGVSSIWIATFTISRARSTFGTLRSGKKTAYILLATVFGPFLGIYASLVAIDRAPVGIASTLMALAPLFIIPIAHFVFGDRVTWRAVLGTVIALVGVSVLFLF